MKKLGVEEQSVSQAFLSQHQCLTLQIYVEEKKIPVLTLVENLPRESKLSELQRVGRHPVKRRGFRVRCHSQVQVRVKADEQIFLAIYCNQV